MSDPARLILAAYAWWAGRRPLTWTATEHLHRPEVNCVSDREKRLAREVAAYYLARQREHDS